MFCSKCGKEVVEGAGFCVACGSPVNVTQQAQSTVPLSRQVQPTVSPQQVEWDFLKMQLASKVKTQAVIWLIIGLIQVLAYGPYLIYLYAEVLWEPPIYGILVLIVGIINICFSIQNFEYSKTILIRPVGIVGKYEPVGGLIGNLIYNVFLGGFLGVIGSIYAFVLRGFVVNNSLKFREMEKAFMGSNTTDMFGVGKVFSDRKN